MDTIEQHRQFMKSNFALPFGPSDQQRGVPVPPLEVPLPDGTPLVPLPLADQAALTAPAAPGALGKSLHQCLVERRSRRKFSEEALTLAELSYLLWATQGVQHVTGDGTVSFRAVPSAGARHPFETLLAVNRVEGLEPGLYRYRPVEHALARLGGSGEALPGLLTAATMGQKYVGGSAVVFFWSCLPYRGEWRYGPHAHKAALLDAGHICQNLYLACEAFGLGTVAIGAYDQAAVDSLLGLDGRDEFVVYLAPVGRPRGKKQA